MPVRPDQVPLDTAKNWAKRLAMATKQHPGKSLTLAQAQQAVARMLGYQDWHNLHGQLNNPATTQLTDKRQWNTALPDTTEGWVCFWQNATALDACSDIHIEQRANSDVRIRVRRYGQMEHYADIPSDRLEEAMHAIFPHDMARELGNRKNLTNYVVGMVHIPGNMRKLINSKTLKFQALPVYPSGMDVVIQAREQAMSVELNSLCLPKDVQLKLMEFADKPDGMFFATGTAGSGRSTLLGAMVAYAGRQYTNDPLRCYSIEYPPEGRMGALTTSLRVERGEKNNIENTVKAALRADPDILALGEIRCQSMAEAARHASNAGVRVMSTVHSAGNNVPERLEDFLPNHPWRDVVNGWATCRLFGILCQACAKELPNGQGRRARNPSGCPQCNQMGFTGRQLCLDIWEMDRSVPRRLHSMRDQANHLVLQGLVDYESVVEALGPA